MKKKLFIILIALCALFYSQVAYCSEKDAVNSDAETFYVQLVSESRPGINRQGGVATLETGREFVALTGVSEQFAASIKRMKFPTLLDGLNRLAVNGWRLVATDTYNNAGQIVTVWTLSKTVTDRAQLLDGLGISVKEQN